MRKILILAAILSLSTLPVWATGNLNVKDGGSNSVYMKTTGVGTDVDPFVPSNNVVESGTWTVQPGNTANTTAWKVDGSAVTQPVSATSLPLPTGAATSANQPGFGTAGTANANVLSVQGITSMTALKVDGSAVTQPVNVVAATTGGLSIWRNINLGSTPENIKGSAGAVCGWVIYNNAANTRYVKLYNKATAPVLASDTPAMTIGVPAGAMSNVVSSMCITFGTGIGEAAVTGVGDTNATAPSANDVVINLLYN